MTFDDIERLEAVARTPPAHRQAAAELSSCAEERSPDDEVSPADLLSAAAWHLEQAGDTEAALGMYRRAVAADGTTTPDARCLLSATLLAAGQLDEARQVADDLRRSSPRIGDFASMAEVFEMAGDLKEGHRWVAMGINRLDLSSGSEFPEEYEVDVLLNVRRRIRRALGFPPDELDEIGR
jgi:tetratricopeptide (TPR) repeat protein